MKKTIPLLSLLVASTALANSIDPEFSIRCVSDDKEWMIELDGFRTGHPQGGITSYTGLMRMTTSRSAVTLQTQFKFKNRRYASWGSSEEIRTRDFLIDFNPSVLSGTPDDSSVLEYRFGTIGPFPPTEWESVDMSCERVDRT